jgi:hypothetical protein
LATRAVYRDCSSGFTHCCSHPYHSKSNMDYTIGYLTTTSPNLSTTPEITVGVFGDTLNGTIYWPLAANPYFPPVNASHTTCTASNVTIFSECCRDLNGTFLDKYNFTNKSITPSGLRETPEGQLYIPWCEVRSSENNSEAGRTPDDVSGFRECVNFKAGDARSGQYVRNFTLEKVAWSCQGVGNNNDVIASWREPNNTEALPQGAAVQVAPSLALLSVAFAFCTWRQ